MIARLKVEFGLSSLPFVFANLLRSPKQRFAQKLSEFFNMPYALLVPSAHGGLYYLLKQLPQKEIFVSAYCCNAVIEACILADKKVNYIDADLDTLSISASSLGRSIKPNSIVLLMHQFGIPCEIDEIGRIAKSNECILIEDSAACFGLAHKSRMCGSFGEASIISFDFTKSLPCARGGAVLFKNEELYKKTLSAYNKEKRKQKLSRLLQRFATLLSFNIFASSFIYEHITLPLFQKKEGFTSYTGELDLRKNHDYNEDFTNLQAAIGLAQLRRINKTIARRKEIAKFYFNKIKSKGLRLIKIPKENSAVMVRFPIMVENMEKGDFYKRCLTKGLDTGFSFSYSYGGNKYRGAQSIAKQILNLPVHSRLSDRELKRIVEIVNSIGPNKKGVRK
ncbi:MAG: DegT/DnrJ/EryC1/StrS aminotransferase family protein [Candidatus Diapherotrites archaeon]|nr:DegT/DnrJ/EryC1/StrS aminotransferase family protein [Candidatus Diapherotrites archaeon]